VAQTAPLLRRGSMPDCNSRCVSGHPIEEEMRPLFLGQCRLMMVVIGVDYNVESCSSKQQH